MLRRRFVSSIAFRMESVIISAYIITCPSLLRAARPIVWISDVSVLKIKADIADYNSAKRYIADYTMDGSQAVKYTTIDNKEYASLVVLYSVREGSKLHKSYTRFVLRKDSDGKWKILYWELINGNNSTQE